MADSRKDWTGFHFLWFGYWYTVIGPAEEAGMWIVRSSQYQSQDRLWAYADLWERYVYAPATEHYFIGGEQ